MGPPVFVENNIYGIKYAKSNTTDSFAWVGVLQDINPMYQMFWLSGYFSFPDASYPTKLSVSMMLR